MMKKIIAVLYIFYIFAAFRLFVDNCHKLSIYCYVFLFTDLLLLFYTIACRKVREKLRFPITVRTFSLTLYFLKMQICFILTQHFSFTDNQNNTHTPDFRREQQNHQTDHGLPAIDFLSIIAANYHIFAMSFPLQILSCCFILSFVKG